ncbi:Metallo-dependent phosphatase-like protein [Biscogniauxia marginata]|nr:Metallo-dependent phosphatase-like protein [Biscogniauxia marginata]
MAVQISLRSAASRGSQGPAYDVFEEICPERKHPTYLPTWRCSVVIIGNIALHRTGKTACSSRGSPRRSSSSRREPRGPYGSGWPEALEIHARLRALTSARTTSLGSEFVLLEPRGCSGCRTPTTVSSWAANLFSLVPPPQKPHGGQLRTARDVAWLNAQVAGFEQAASPITGEFSKDLSGRCALGALELGPGRSGTRIHYNCDFAAARDGGAGPLRLLANQRGYYFAQAPGFDGEKTVEI